MIEILAILKLITGLKMLGETGLKMLGEENNRGDHGKTEIPKPNLKKRPEASAKIDTQDNQGYFTAPNSTPISDSNILRDALESLPFEKTREDKREGTPQTLDIPTTPRTALKGLLETTTTPPVTPVQVVDSGDFQVSQVDARKIREENLAEINELKTQNAALEKGRKELISEIENLKSQLVAYKKKKEVYDPPATPEEAKTSREKNAKREMTRHQSLEVVRGENASLNKRLDELKVECQELEKSNKSLQEHNARLQDEVGGLLSKSEDKIALNTKIQNLQEELTKLRTQLASKAAVAQRPLADEDFPDIERSEYSQKQFEGKVEEEKQKLLTELTAANEAKAEVDREKEDLQRELDSEREAKGKLEEAKAVLEEELTAARRQVEEQTQQLQQLTAAKNSVDREKQGLQGELNAANEANAKLAREKSEVEEAREAIARDQESLQRDLTAANEAKAEVDREKEDLQRELREANESKESLQRDLTAANEALKISMYSRLFNHISSHKGKYILATTCIALAAAEYKEGVLTKVFEVCKEWIAANAPTKIVEMLGLSKQGEQIASVVGLNS